MFFISMKNISSILTVYNVNMYSPYALFTVLLLLLVLLFITRWQYLNSQLQTQGETKWGSKTNETKTRKGICCFI